MPSFLDASLNQDFIDKTKPKILNESRNDFNYFSNSVSGNNLAKESISLSNLVSGRSKKSPSATIKIQEDSSMLNDLNAILREISIVSRRVRDHEENEYKSLEWKFAAMVVDRFCFIFFATSTLISDMLILITCENFFKSSDPDPQF